MSLQYWGRNFAGQSTQYAATPVTFASLPPASSVEGQVRVLSDVNYIEVVSRGGVWRPRGGRQVLARKYDAPVTTQNTSYIAAARIGPFPGGLVRANMGLVFRYMYDAGAIGSVARRTRATVGTAGHALSDAAWVAATSSGTSSLTLRGEAEGRINVLSDTLVNHSASPRSDNGGYENIVNGYIITSNSKLAPPVDFSQPWDMAVWFQSGNETAVTITGASWAAGEATYNATAHTLAVGDKTTVAGITPSGYNQVGIVTAVPNADSFKMALASDPGAYTSGGTSSRISNVVLQSYTLTLEG